MQKYNQFPRQGNNFQTFVPDTVRTFKVFLRVTTDNVVASRGKKNLLLLIFL